MVTRSIGNLHGTVKPLLIVIVAMLLFAAIATTAITQTSNDLPTLSYQAFGQVADVYRSGGQAPVLVDKLNQALALIQEAQFKKSQGDEANAVKLEDQARSTMAQIMSEVPAAQQKAALDSTTRTIVVVASIPVVVAASTLIFYVTLRTWRWYERMKLFEMRIVVGEKKTED